MTSFIENALAIEGRNLNYGVLYQEQGNILTVDVICGDETI